MDDPSNEHAALATVLMEQASSETDEAVLRDLLSQLQAIEKIEIVNSFQTDDYTLLEKVKASIQLTETKLQNAAVSAAPPDKDAAADAAAATAAAEASAALERTAAAAREAANAVAARNAAAAAKEAATKKAAAAAAAKKATTAAVASKPTPAKQATPTKPAEPVAAAAAEKPKKPAAEPIDLTVPTRSPAKKPAGERLVFHSAFEQGNVMLPVYDQQDYRDLLAYFEVPAKPAQPHSSGRGDTATPNNDIGAMLSKQLTQMRVDMNKKSAQARENEVQSLKQLQQRTHARRMQLMEQERLRSRTQSGVEDDTDAACDPMERLATAAENIDSNHTFVKETMKEMKLVYEAWVDWKDGGDKATAAKADFKFHFNVLMKMASGLRHCLNDDDQPRFQPDGKDGVYAFIGVLAETTMSLCASA